MQSINRSASALTTMTNSFAFGGTLEGGRR
jgi:hypothetical protein